MRIRWWKLFDSEAAVGTIDPVDVLVVPFDAGTDVLHLWKVRRVRAGAVRDASLDAGGEADDEGEGHDESGEGHEEDGAEGEEGGEGHGEPDEFFMLAREMELALEEVMAGEDFCDDDEGEGLHPPVVPAAADPAAGAAGPPAAAAVPAGAGDDEVGAADGARDKAEVFHVGYGLLSYYATTGDIVAQCGNPAHGARCRATATTRPKAARKGAGRPLGFLMAFVKDTCACVQDHKDASLAGYPFNLRKEGRDDLVAIPGSEVLLSKERDLLDEPHSEPLLFQRPRGCQ